MKLVNNVLSGGYEKQQMRLQTVQNSYVFYHHHLQKGFVKWKRELITTETQYHILEWVSPLVLRIHEQ